jgi:hypothetical protein
MTEYAPCGFENGGGLSVVVLSAILQNYSRLTPLQTVDKIRSILVWVRLVTIPKMVLAARILFRLFVLASLSSTLQN